MLTSASAGGEVKFFCYQVGLIIESTVNVVQYTYICPFMCFCENAHYLMLITHGPSFLVAPVAPVAPVGGTKKLVFFILYEMTGSTSSTTHFVPRHHKSEYSTVKLVTRPSPRPHPTYSSSRPSYNKPLCISPVAFWYCTTASMFYGNCTSNAYQDKKTHLRRPLSSSCHRQQ